MARKDQENNFRGVIPEEGLSVFELLTGKPVQPLKIPSKFDDKVQHYRLDEPVPGYDFRHDATVIHVGENGRKSVVITEKTATGVTRPEALALINNGEVDGPYRFETLPGGSPSNPTFSLSGPEGEVPYLSLQGDGRIARRLIEALPISTEKNKNILPAGYLALFVKDKLDL